MILYLSLALCVDQIIPTERRVQQWTRLVTDMYGVLCVVFTRFSHILKEVIIASVVYLGAQSQGTHIEYNMHRPQLSIHCLGPISNYKKNDQRPICGANSSLLIKNGKTKLSGDQLSSLQFLVSQNTALFYTFRPPFSFLPSQA